MADRNPSIRTGDWYDYPQYYDLLCADETALEVAFIEQATQRYGPAPLKRLYEPGCGSGRLVEAFAKRGYQVTAIDSNARALEFVRERLQRRGLRAKLVQADMTSFVPSQAVDVAFCLMNTFRHLLTEDAAERHLRCVAQSLRSGGLYLLGFHLLPPDVDDACIERWTARRGRLKAHVTLRVLDTNRVQRWEQIRISLRVRAPRLDLRLRTEFRLRRYTAAQFKNLLRKVPDFELLDVYDFWYDIEHPLKLDNHLTDAVFVLRRR